VHRIVRTMQMTTVKVLSLIFLLIAASYVDAKASGPRRESKYFRVTVT